MGNGASCARAIAKGRKISGGVGAAAQRSGAWNTSYMDRAVSHLLATGMARTKPAGCVMRTLLRQASVAVRPTT
jgi:hypothetical protein